jgi:beta-lactamase class A
MIVYSDNASKELLHRHLESISPGILQQTFIDLGIALQKPDGSNYITVKTYASLFRGLFNASYLNREMSQYALELLASVEFPNGIVAGLPSGTVVAHKFGFLDLQPDERQLHDCGIVYHTKTPYLLCVMTRGKDPEEISSIIGKISKAVYDEVSLSLDK